ncbi:hypothetical protein C8J57DRAFT_1521094 [Mycena rebaudengoi]|nr:hypothetical protein C8J57DRAFT_1521094 [Mycena rebaudengoi]
MFSKIILLALCALLSVHAFPSSPVTPDLAPSNLRRPVGIKIINSAVNGSAFTFNVPHGAYPAEVLIQGGNTHNGLWERYTVGVDKYTFKNDASGEWITVGDEGHLVTVPGVAHATVFAIESAGGGELKSPYADEVWEALYDGTSPIYGRVVLRPARGSSYQRWILE